ncbi:MULTISPECIES: HAD hydrolase-like protein [Thermomonosporaceae]|uniref:HAD hydrolase-like protein n=1 Tax=Thermomonosporaceae TaxID=2012 RepID=UPI00255AFF77|nr:MULTISPECIES: HAD hydrolase-like protein [Thermomonosporaceae]MDL4774790.1 haloacid dehalogenase-like hydrolase [Actinomadura xylanilytica]
MRTLVLWDIDHTLIKVTGFSRVMYAEAFLQVTGRPLEQLAPMAGRTERAISSETLLLHGITPTDPLVESLTTALASAFTARRHEIDAHGHALPGAHAALDALAVRDEAVQSVLTGNVRTVAVHKLAAFGLDHLVDFEVGAYGTDHIDRPPLVRLAQRRAHRKYAHPFDAATTVLVGDTPHDVAAGRQGGARVIAVATGFSDEDTLRAAGADLVLPDLSDTATLVKAILRTD